MELSYKKYNLLNDLPTDNRINGREYNYYRKADDEFTSILFRFRLIIVFELQYHNYHMHIWLAYKSLVIIHYNYHYL